MHPCHSAEGESVPADTAVPSAKPDSFHKRRLLAAGVPVERIDEFQLKVNALPNLQLLEGPINVEKQDILPLAWAQQKYGDQVDAYLLSQELRGLPEELPDVMKERSAVPA